MSARATDPETSVEAGRDTAGRQAIRHQLLNAYATDLAYHDGRGLTDEQAMMMCGFDLADDGHRRRCSDLRRDGLIAQVVIDGVPQTAVSARTGARRMVCTLTEAGIEALSD